LVHLFARTLLTMSAGEHEDLLLTGQADVGPEVCRLMIERKSGSEFALFAKAGAILATEDPEVIENYGAFGLCFGTASQIYSDVQDIWGGETSTDLLNGKRTLPVVHALSALQGGSREQLMQLLTAARESAECHDEVRVLLTEAGSIQYTVLMLEAYRQRAREHLAAASPREPAGKVLRDLLDGASLLATSEGAYQ
jgi:geranylgeranyl pyrophosphate synthase